MTITQPFQVKGNKIIAQNGAPFIPHGVNLGDYANVPDGRWRGQGESDGFGYSLGYRPVVVDQNLAVMKSWGINSIRCLCLLSYFIDNPSVTSTTFTGNFFDALIDLINRAAARDMCVIVAPAGVYSGLRYVNGLPWGAPADADPSTLMWHLNNNPDYAYAGNTDPVALAYMPNTDAFVAMWQNIIAPALASRPNVILELYNEPLSYPWTAEVNEYFGVAQRCINAIRGVGAVQPIILQCGSLSHWDLFTNVHQPCPKDWMPGGLMGRGEVCDSQKNIVYSTHAYASSPYYNGVACGDVYANIVSYCSAIGLDEYSLNYPFIVGEVGALNQYDSGYYPQTCVNFMRRLNDLGIGYLIWQWNQSSTWKVLQGGNWIPQPDDMGTAFIDKICVGNLPAKVVSANLLGGIMG